MKEAFDTNWVVPLGPNVNGFEKDLEEFVNQNGRMEELKNGSLSKRVVALSAGTAAVHLGLLNCGVKPGDEVIVQSFTFCASTHPVTYLGATPVLVDSEPDTWNIDPELLEEAIKDRKARRVSTQRLLFLWLCMECHIRQTASWRLLTNMASLWWRMQLRALVLATRDRCWAHLVSMVCCRSMVIR